MAVRRMNLVVLDHRLQLIRHVTDGKEMNHRGNKGHHQEHDGSQAIDAITELEVDGGLPCQSPQTSPRYASCPGIGCTGSGGGRAILAFGPMPLSRGAGVAGMSLRGMTWSVTLTLQEQHIADEAQDERQAHRSGGNIGA